MYYLQGSIGVIKNRGKGVGPGRQMRERQMKDYRHQKLKVPQLVSDQYSTLLLTYFNTISAF